MANPGRGRVVLCVAPARHQAEMVRMFGRLPHLGILTLAAVLERSGYQATTLDWQYEPASPPDLAREILAHHPALVGFTLYDTNVEFTRSAIEALRHVYTGPIVVGGYGATFHAQELLDHWPEIDYVVAGEGEAAIVGLVEHLDGERRIDEVPNLVRRSQAGPVFNPRAPLADLTQLPWPRREWSPACDVAPIATRRGCTGRCAFCCSASFYDAQPGPAVRSRDPEDVVDEMAHRVDHGDRLFMVYDENFGLSTPEERTWAARFVEMIQRRGLRVAFWLEMRPVDVIRGRSLLPDLREAGLAHLAMGMESLLDRQLRLYGKGQRADDVRRAVAILQEVGLDYQTNVIFWDPYLTLDEAVDHVERLGDLPIQDQLASANFPFYGGMLTVRQGTPLHRQFSQEGILRADPRAWYRYQTDFVDPAVRDFHRDVYPAFIRSVSADRLPALWINVPRLELEGRGHEAALLRTYGRALARAEYDYFRAVLRTARDLADPQARARELASIDEELGQRFRQQAAALDGPAYPSTSRELPGGAIAAGQAWRGAGMAL